MLQPEQSTDGIFSERFFLQIPGNSEARMSVNCVDLEERQKENLFP